MLLRHIMPYEMNKFEEHLLRLSKEDRRLRFGNCKTDETIKQYVSGIGVFDNVIYGCFDDDLNIIAAVHIAVLRTEEGKIAELGLSVEREHRGKGYGHELFKKAVEWGESRGISQLFTQCLRENSYMMKIARREGMDTTMEDGEVLAHLNIQPQTIPHIGKELYEECLAWFDFAVKKQFLILKDITTIPE